MLDHLPIIVLMVEILLLVLISLFLYKNIFNPIATFACYNVGLFTIGSYLNTVLLQLDYIDFPISALNETWVFLPTSIVFIFLYICYKLSKVKFI